ncbi:MAG: polyprenyl synthetase family protein [Clostridia bacterium]|nr:polyprenyl synthetase family protein [Clostridia bacterium]
MKISEISKTEYLASFQEYLERSLSLHGFALEEAMRYATVDGGKRIRPLLVYLGARAAGDAECEGVLALAYAVELVHSYSLVHDDLPAMDDDDMRRGKLSVHKKFGEANGILVGDALLTEAAESLFRNANVRGENYLSACYEIMLGASKMVDGQVRDLAGCKTKNEYLETYSLKTGALILASMRAGARLACADESTLERVSAYARNLGLAFQLADDLLDDDGEPSIINAIGREETVRLLNSATESAIRSADFLKNSEELKEFARMLAVRKK